MMRQEEVLMGLAGVAMGQSHVRKQVLEESGLLKLIPAHLFSFSLVAPSPTKSYP